MSELVRYEIKDGVAVITIDNPPVNALSLAVWEGIDEAVARGSADPNAEAIVLIGAGATFIAGADIKVFDLLKTREDSLARSEKTHALLRRLEDATRPLVAAIHGNALGGGLEVAQACHFRVATKDAKVGQPEVMLGIIPGAGGTQRLPRAVPLARAMEMILTAEPITVGRDPKNDIVLDDRRISRRHAEVRLRLGRYTLYDLQSTNGTFVNGRRIAEMVLSDEDRITIGGAELVVRLEG